MILNKAETGWEIIYQRAHALLAAKLVTYWRPEDRPLRWTETLNAIAQHDNGWQEWEPGQRLTASGAPRHFSETPLNQIVQQAERVVDRAWHQSLWVGLLISRHISHLYEPQRGNLTALDQLLDEQQSRRQQWRRFLEVTSEEVDAAYALLLWGDTLSLILCCDDLPFDERRLEIGRGPQGKDYNVRQCSKGTVTIDPWPYTQDEFSVAVDVHQLNQLTFESEEALAQALHHTPVSRRVWHLAR